MAARIGPAPDVRRRRRAAGVAGSAGERAPGKTLLATLLALILALAGGCVPAAAGPSTEPAPASFAAVPPDVARTASALEAAFRRADIGLIRAGRPYVPSEPLDVRTLPRTVYQEVLPADPGAGFVVIYEAETPDAAMLTARSLASYVASGFGVTNYPPDARFAVEIYGPTVVFGWWSPGSSADPATAAVAFGVLQTFGTPVPVVR